MTSQTELACQELMRRLSQYEGLSSKKMFGGFGIFCHGKMFGMVTSDGGTCLKARPEDTELWAEAGFEKFGKMPYWRVPEDIFTDDEAYFPWVDMALDLTRS